MQSGPGNRLNALPETGNRHKAVGYKGAVNMGSVKTYKDLTVIRETVIACGADWREHPNGETIARISVERRGPDWTEILLPTDPLFIEAVEATK